MFCLLVSGETLADASEIVRRGVNVTKHNVDTTLKHDLIIST